MVCRMKLRDLAKLAREIVAAPSGTVAHKKHLFLTQALYILSRPTCGGEVGEPGLDPHYDKNDVGVATECSVCHLRRKPRGRSEPLALCNSLCDFECEGYHIGTEVGDLWPGETRGEFGYPKCLHCADCIAWGNEDG